MTAPALTRFLTPAHANPMCAGVRSQAALIAQGGAQSVRARVTPPRAAAGARWHPRSRVERRVPLTRLDSAFGHRAGVHVRLLCIERVPHHGPLGGGTGVDRERVAVEVLCPPGAAPIAGARLLPCRVASRRAGHRRARAMDDHRPRWQGWPRDVGVGSAPGRLRRGLLRVELGHDRALVQWIRSARAPVVTGGGRAVLRAVVARGRPLAGLP